MAEESEKRFQKIMDRLHRYPKSSGGEADTLRKGKRTGGISLYSQKSVESERRKNLAVGGGVKDFPQPCRPWDRGDLMRRLWTYKAMTWFGKPKTVSPVNCARRGWVNVDIDTITCEACGSRFLFSTPSSWTYNQVEKAAAVFSLKLNNGHKAFCPWKDNICDESLAFFPPTPVTSLVEGYRRRALALLKLSALPVISSYSINCTSSSQLKQLLEEVSCVGSTLNKGIKLDVNSGLLESDFSSELASTTSLYFQAQIVISLCGWEARLLPYHVDSEVKLDQSVDKTKSTVGCLTGEKTLTAVTRSSNILVDDEERHDQRSLGNQCDSSSAVLDCKYCGACVGLWAFKTTERPLELYKLSDFPDVVDHDRQKPLENQSEGCSILNLTIAGGLPPAKQNFRPKISLPIISRHLRADFCTVYDAKDYSYSTLVEKHNTVEQAQGCPLQHQSISGNCGVIVSTGNVDTLKRKRKDNHFALDNEKTGAETPNNEFIVETSEDNGEKTSHLSQETELCNSVLSHNMHHDFADSEGVIADNRINNIDIEENKSLDPQNFSEPNISNIDGLKREVIPPTITGLAVPNISGTDDVQMKCLFFGNDIKEFDPIVHHRPFCPWIVSRNGDGMPGWKLTLSALVEEKDSSPYIPKEAPLRLTNEVDDAIVSVRKIFTSPQSKRSKDSI